MKPDINLRLLLLNTLTAVVLHGGSATYTWAPEGTEASATQGGAGQWNAAYALWWDGTKIIAAGGNGRDGNRLPFGSATQDATLNFNGKGGTIIKTDIAFFGSNPKPNRTHTLNFAPGSHYTLTSPDLAPWGAISSGALAHIVYNVGKGATLTLGGNGQQIALVTGSDVSAGPGLLFTGGGVVDLRSRTLVRNGSANSRLTIREGTTVNFNDDTLYTAMTGNFAKPLPPVATRIALEDGTLTVNGGRLITGYHAKALALAGPDGRGFGIAVGATPDGAPATLNLVSGEITALGDPRSAGGNDSYAGIAIGLGATNKGGIVNLKGGTLAVTNIRARVAPGGTAILNLDGATVKVSTAESLDSGYSSANATQLQTRLDGFITGFEGTESSHIEIGENGVVFDTTGIGNNAKTTVATIASAIRGKGGLLKKGNNGLRLVRANTYTGTTIIEGGELFIDGKTASVASNITVGSGATLGGTGRVNGKVTLREGATLLPGNDFLRGNDLEWHSGARIGINLTTVLDKPFLHVKNLKKTGSGPFEISVTGAISGQHVIFDVTEKNDFSADDITVTVNDSPAVLLKEGNRIVFKLP
ncbi:hypothetical protein OPIT5_12855 [Opitutaceae bacterium TAV5]|nr:hypothetical protein OPIT5_12855 [Opitutaceae bacterium TAV5]